MSDDHYNDTETDTDSDDDNVIVKNNTHPNYKNITTEGSISDVGYDPKLGLMQCELCGKHYTPNILVMVDPLQCLHCFFFMNYGNKSMINGQNGLTVQNYIDLCSKDHMTPCARLADGSCNCYICAHNLGFPLDGVTIEQSANRNPIDIDESERDCKIDDIGDDVFGNTEKVFVVL
jgi:hypothetical protein